MRESQIERKYLTIERAAETPATKKQLYALYCITKKDYRNSNLTKFEAYNLLSTLMVGKKKTTKKNILIADFDEQYKDIADRVYKEFISKVLNVQSDVINSKSKKKYAFFGFGCGFVYFKYNKNSKILSEFDEYVQKAYRERIINDVKNKLGKNTCNIMQRLGSPVDALLMQDMTIKNYYYGLCADIATNHGKKIDVECMID